MSKAIVIHSPTPNAIQVLKYVTQKYGLECSNEKDAAELIRLAKLVSRYAVKYRRFVAEKKLRILGQGSCDSNTLLFASGKLSRKVVKSVGKAHLGECFC